NVLADRAPPGMGAQMRVGPMHVDDVVALAVCANEREVIDERAPRFQTVREVGEIGILVLLREGAHAQRSRIARACIRVAVGRGPLLDLRDGPESLHAGQERIYSLLQTCRVRELDNSWGVSASYK